MKIPSALVESLKTVAGFNKESFIEVHHSGQQVTSIRLNPAKNATSNLPQDAVHKPQTISPGAKTDTTFPKDPPSPSTHSFTPDVTMYRKRQACFLNRP